MTLLKNIFLVFCLVGSCLCYAQKTLTSDAAIKGYEELSALMEESFPANENKTFLRESFSEQQLQTYLSQHYKRLDLLPLIQEHYSFKMHSYLHAGNWFKAMEFSEESIKWYTVFFEYYDLYASKLSAKERDIFFENITYSYSSLADNYARIGKLDSAAIIHEKNIEFIKDHDNIYNPSAYNNYGLFFYWNKKELDSALFYFNKAYQITLEKFPNHSLLGSIRDNMADVYSDKNQPEKALVLYKANFELYSVIKNEITSVYDIPRLISAGTQLIETEVKLNQLIQAEATFKRLQKIIENPQFKKDMGPSSKLEILKARGAIYRAQNNFKLAHDIALKQIDLIDSTNTVSKIADKKWQEELNTISLDRVALNFKIDKIVNENKINSQRFKLWIISIIFLSIIGFLTALYLRRKGLILFAKNKQLLAEQNLKLTDFENKQLQSEIASKKRDLSDFAISLTQNQEWAKELADKMKNIKIASSKEQVALINELEHDIHNKITVNADTQEFYERLDRLSDSFYSELTRQFAKLSKNEIRLCSLIRLKMDSRSIATLQNITLASLNTSRYRLRKKLNLSEDVDLDDFIQNL